MLTRLYLRASTAEQDATRARATLEAFAQERSLQVAGTYIENESGAFLQRPELFRLLSDSRPGDILLTEQIDRLSRLTEPDWKRLRGEIEARQVRILALDLPTSWALVGPGDEFTARMFGAINGMLMDVLAAVARKDYTDRRRRQAEGIKKARAEGRFRGRAENKDRNGAIGVMLEKGLSWTQIQQATGCARGTVARIAKRARAVPHVL